MYRLLCLKDAWLYFGKSEGGKMAVTFFNLTKSLSDSKGFQLMQSYMLKSRWFWQKGVAVGSEVGKRIEFSLFSYILASPYSKGFGMIGENVVVGVMDELDSPMDSAKQKGRVLKAYEATVRRFESRFVIRGRTIGRLFLVASKQDELSFLETYIEQMKGSPNVLVFDFPLWEAHPQSMYCGKKFTVSCGDPYTSPKILETEEEKKDALLKGFKVIDVPVEYRNAFEVDLVGALRDIAGVSVRYVRKSKLFPSPKLIEECYDESVDPVTVREIKLGLKSEDELINFLDLSKIIMPKEVPRCVHMDIAVSGDALGIAMSGVLTSVTVNAQKPDGTFVKQKVPVVRTDFVMRITAPEGEEIPLNKIRKLVLDLKARGFNIVLFTADLKLASTDTLQILKVAGVESKYFSVDRTAEPYLDFKQMVIEKRWSCYRNEYLHFELSNLEYDREKGKVDHPDLVKDVFLKDGNLQEVVLKGSKDMADAVCGSVCNAVESMENIEVMDVDVMKALLQKVGKSESGKLSLYWWVSTGSGQEVIAVGQEYKKFIDILKKRKR